MLRRPPKSTLFPSPPLFRSLLTNGKVLIVGGDDSNWNEIGAAELYDPAAGAFSFTGALNTARDSHTATVLSNGDRKSTRLNSSHSQISYAVFFLKKKDFDWS